MLGREPWFWVMTHVLEVVGSNPGDVYRMDNFFTLICCRKFIVCLKRPKIKKKRPGLAHLKNKLRWKSFSKDQSLELHLRCSACEKNSNCSKEIFLVVNNDLKSVFKYFCKLSHFTAGTSIFKLSWCST